MGNAPDPDPTDLDVEPVVLMRRVARASIPAVEAQTTLRGRKMRLGPVVDEGVLVLYGDYDQNTGPINVIALDADGTATTLLSDFNTEETQNARALNDAVWLPSIDPRGASAGSLATNHGSTWHTVPVTVSGLPVAEHIFDVAQEPNGDLYVCGAHTPDTAFVWCSTDDGATWTEVLAVPSGRADGYNRFYELGRVGGKLTVQRSAYGHYTKQADESWIFTAGFPTWDTRPGPQVYAMDGHTFVSVPGRGVVAEFPFQDQYVTASLADDGSVWICDTATIYLVAPPT